MVKTKIIRPPIAVKAERGTLSLWTKDGRFGGGTQPEENKQSWPMHLLPDTAASLLADGYSLSITQHD